MRGSDVEPEGIAWQVAGDAMRRAYFEELGRQAYRMLFGQMLAGIGADGQRLKPVKPESRPDGAKGPPLNPRTVASRSARLLSYAGGKDGATVFWRGGWGRIVGFHARGDVPHAPVRNIVGLTPGRFRHAVYETRRWWARHTPPYGLPPLPSIEFMPIPPLPSIPRPAAVARPGGGQPRSFQP